MEVHEHLPHPQRHQHCDLTTLFAARLGPPAPTDIRIDPRLPLVLSLSLHFLTFRELVRIWDSLNIDDDDLLDEFILWHGHDKTFLHDVAAARSSPRYKRLIAFYRARHRNLCHFFELKFTPDRVLERIFAEDDETHFFEVLREFGHVFELSASQLVTGVSYKAERCLNALTQIREVIGIGWRGWTGGVIGRGGLPMVGVRRLLPIEGGAGSGEKAIARAGASASAGSGAKNANAFPEGPNAAQSTRGVSGLRKMRNNRRASTDDAAAGADGITSTTEDASLPAPPQDETTPVMEHQQTQVAKTVRISVEDQVQADAENASNDCGERGEQSQRQSLAPQMDIFTYKEKQWRLLNSVPFSPRNDRRSKAIAALRMENLEKKTEANHSTAPGTSRGARSRGAGRFCEAPASGRFAAKAASSVRRSNESENEPIPFSVCADVRRTRRRWYFTTRIRHGTRADAQACCGGGSYAGGYGNSWRRWSDRKASVEHCVEFEESPCSFPGPHEPPAHRENHSDRGGPGGSGNHPARALSAVRERHATARPDPPPCPG
mmetsp:Transcript_16528/g.40916  ORF Transcript_16528/g.40916 Transcript_16528/m.40916 type:complete len:549 (+) Transcript_16528:452-2098(+)